MTETSRQLAIPIITTVPNPASPLCEASDSEPNPIMEVNDVNTSARQVLADIKYFWVVRLKS